MSNIYAVLLAVVPALLNIGILFYLLFFLPRGKTTNIFAFFVIALILWQSADSAARLVGTEEAMQFWDRMFSVGWIMVAPLLFHFTAHYTSSRQLTSRLSLTLVYTPFIILYLLYVSNGNEVNLSYHSFWGWLSDPRPGTPDIFQRQLIAVVVIVNVFILFRYALRQKQNKERKYQALLITIGILIPTVQGSITQVIFPTVLGMDIPLTSAFLTFFSLGTIIAFNKYHLFNVSESLEVKGLLDNINSIVVAIAPDEKIIYNNSYTSGKLSLHDREGNLQLRDLFLSDDKEFQKFKSEVFLKSLDGNAVDHYESHFCTSGKGIVYVVLSAEPIRNNKLIQGVLLVATDITERKKSEDLIRKSKERYEAVVKSTSDAIWDYEFALGRTFIVGTGHKELFGYNLVEEYGADDYWESRLHPEDKERALRDKKEALENSLTKQGYSEYRFLKADGSYADILDRFSVMYENDKPVRMIGAMQDISARKHSERILALEKAIYEFNTTTGISLADVLKELSLRIENLLPGSYCSILQRTEDDLLQHLAGPSMPSEYVKAIDGLRIGPSSGCCGTAVYTGKPVIVSDIEQDPLWDDYRSEAQPFGFKACWSIPIKNSNGKVTGSFAIYYKKVRTPHPLELNAMERAAGLVGVVIENHNAVEEIKLAKERYDIVAKATSDTIWDLDMQKDKISYNQGIYTMFGYSRAEVQNTGLWWQEKLHPDDLQRINNELKHAFTAGKSHLQLEYRFLCADESYKHVLDRAYIAYDENQKPVRIIGAMQDITERKQHLQAIEEQNRKLREIAWIQSHMVRAPLARILGLADILNFPARDGSETSELLEYIVASANELDEVIKDIVEKSANVETETRHPEGKE